MRTQTRVNIRVRDIRGATTGAFMGQRLEVTIANNAGNEFGKPCPSFRKPYFVRDFAIAKEEDFTRAMAMLKADGYEVVTK